MPDCCVVGPSVFIGVGNRFVFLRDRVPLVMQDIGVVPVVLVGIRNVFPIVEFSVNLNNGIAGTGRDSACKSICRGANRHKRGKNQQYKKTMLLHLHTHPFFVI